MVEPIQLFQDSFGTLVWNKVAAAWQNNALHIGSYHRYKLPNARSQSLFTADGHDAALADGQDGRAVPGAGFGG